MDTVDGMRAFAAVATQGSFTAGARRIGISTKLASKYVRQLEERLGAQLFNRTTRNVSLTETGRAYFERCTPLLDQFDELEDLVQERQSELAGNIRITAPTGFGSKQLVDALQPFQKAHPKVEIDLHLSDQYVSVVEEGFDLAIRFGGLKDSSLVARKLADMRVVVCASQDYLAEYGEPRFPADLADHNCLLMTSSNDPVQWEFKIGGALRTVSVTGTFRANSPRAVAHMAAGGLGIGLVPIYIAAPFLEQGSLKLLFEAEEAKVLGLYAVYPPNRHLTARIRAVIDHLAKILR